MYHTFVEPLPTEGSTRTTALSAETINAVHKFYEREDISRQAPGRKDVKTIIDDNGKNKVQIRHLLFSLKEAYAIFSEEYGKVIGKSKFATLRPKHVMLNNKLPHNVCLCRYHENFISAINSFHKAVPQMPEYNHNLPAVFVCEEPTAECWFGKCETCQNFMRTKLWDICANSEECNVEWFVWQESNGRLLKVQEEGTIQDLVHHILNIGPTFLEHYFIKREQSKSYQADKELLISTPQAAMMQVDFSENYTCVAQDEIQSAHWQQSQVSIFTAIIWHSETSHSFVLVSDILDHTKNTVIPYIVRLLEELPSDIKEVTIWSDGPSSQFKNRYIAEAIQILSNMHDIRITWKYFATSHGKGPVDGIGGAVKHKVWSAVRSRKYIVNNATNFVEALNPTSKVAAILMHEEDILQRSRKINLSTLVKNCKPFFNIAKFHHLELHKGEVTGHTTSSEAKKEKSREHKLGNDVAVDDWVVVKYDDVHFPGIVTKIENEDCKVAVMVKYGKLWKWPESKDEIYYTRNNIIRKVNPPSVANARGYFKFDHAI